MLIEALLKLIVWLGYYLLFLLVIAPFLVSASSNLNDIEEMDEELEQVSFMEIWQRRRN